MALIKSAMLMFDITLISQSEKQFPSDVISIFNLQTQIYFTYKSYVIRK